MRVENSNYCELVGRVGGLCHNRRQVRISEA